MIRAFRSSGKKELTNAIFLFSVIMKLAMHSGVRKVGLKEDTHQKPAVSDLEADIKKTMEAANEKNDFDIGR